MIQSIKLSNFQSHEETELNFDPGVNSIIGSSNSGKTSILRGLFWVINNRPSGQSFISHWNQTKKGAPIENTEVTVNLENDTILRGRGKEFNGYEINDKSLEAVGTDVPEEVTAAFNLGEVNIQKQMDAPFLLSESAGGVARFFNREIRLDLIDRILTAAERIRRATNQNIQNEIASIDKLEMNMADLDWVSTADKILAKAEKVNIGIESGKQQIETLQTTISSFNKCLLTIEECDVVIPAQSLIISIEKKTTEIEALENKIVSLEHYIDAYKKKKDIVNKIPDLAQAELLLLDIAEATVQLNLKQQAVDSLSFSIRGHNKYSKTVLVANSEIETNEQKLPDTCPLCGGKI